MNKPATEGVCAVMVNRPDVLLLDNRDSFTWNLAHAFGELGATVSVEDSLGHDAASIQHIAPRLVCIGPGPRGPRDLPQLLALLRGLDPRVPIFGVCLGLQLIVEALGGSVAHARAPIHGKRVPVWHDGDPLFRGLPSPLWVMRYHSLVARDVGEQLSVIARDADGQTMAVRARAAPYTGVQFHPESIGTAGGLLLLRNVLLEAGIAVREPTARPGGIPPVGDQGPGFPQHRAVLSDVIRPGEAPVV